MVRKLANDCFALPPGVDWTPVDEALARLKERLDCVAATASMPLLSAAGHVLADPIYAARPHPAHHNAAVDGYAIRLSHGGKQSYRLLEHVAAAGRPADVIVKEGEAVRILTGALLPDGADTVVLQEESTVESGFVKFDAMPKLGANSRPVGEDTKQGALVLSAGTLLDERAVAHAVSTGIADVHVYRPLRVGVLSTGDEVVPIGQFAEPHQVFDANAPMLAGLLVRWGYTLVDLGHIPDNANLVKQTLRLGVDKCDAILTSGGASAGDEDHIASVLRSEADLHTWRIAIKPGRPLALANWDGVPIFGLPGNPIAAYVCALIFARPAFQILQGRVPRNPQGYNLPAGFSKRKKAGRSEYPRAKVRSDGKVELFGSEGSGRVSGLRWADGLVEFGHKGQQINEGDFIRYIPFSSFD
ncbi:MAG: molybdopterin-binding protein [Pseudomonadota bacterium]